MGSLKAEIDVLPLKECCKILRGQVFKKDQLDDEPPPHFKTTGQQSLFQENHKPQKSLFDVPIIPYIRIKDIQQGQATKGSSWLNREAASAVDPKWKLKTGDILLSKSGTIGKAGVVRNGGVGAIAASGLFILRPDQNHLDPHFLWAYLCSDECRSWLDDKARGATIRHLSKHTLDEMPVPQPPLQIQQRVAAQHREHSVDALTLLVQLLIEGEDDPVVKWVDDALRYLKSEKSSGIEHIGITPLLLYQLQGQPFADLPNLSVRQDLSQNALGPWVVA